MPAQSDNPENKEEVQQPTRRQRIIRRRKRDDTSKKSKKQQPVGDEIKDDREPKIGFFSHLHMLRIFGWNCLLIAIGCIGAMAYGLIPISM